MSTKSRAVLSIVLHLAVIAAPALGWLLHAPDVVLTGVVPPSKPVSFSWPAWRDNEVQTQIQAAAEGRIGFRGVMVRTDNSLQELTGDAKPGSQVIHGKHDALFVCDDIWPFTRRPEDVPDLGRVRELADRVADLQGLLAARGTPLVVIVSPSKTSLYPEDVPDRWKAPGPGTLENGAAAPNAFRDQLRARGAPFTDAATVLRDKAAGDERVRETLFAKGARHWTPIGACLVLRQALASILPDLPCETDERHVPIGIHWDRDLLVLLNRWERVTEEDAVLPRFVVTPQRWVKPLLVGTSFSQGLREWLRGPSADVVRLFYYNSTIIDGTTTTTKTVGQVERHSASWERFVGDRNLFIFEVLESQVDGNYMRAFIEDMLAREKGATP